MLHSRNLHRMHKFLRWLVVHWSYKTNSLCTGFELFQLHSLNTWKDMEVLF